MIFIALAIVILVISFVIALLTLLREQKSFNSQSFEGNTGANNSTSNKVAKTTPKAEASEDLIEASDIVPGQRQSSNAEGLNEPFPWEKNLTRDDTSGGEKTASQQENISGDLWSSNPKEETSGVEQKLSGVISIKDITGKSR